MDRATQPLRMLAVLTFILSLGTMLFQMSLFASGTATLAIYVGFSGVINNFIWVTCVALGLATGVAAIVIAALHHHRRWLPSLVIVTAITPYGPLVVSLLIPRFLIGSSGIESYLRWLSLSYTVLPFVTALVVLAYTVRSHRQSSVPPPPDDSNLEIEYSRVD